MFEQTKANKTISERTRLPVEPQSPKAELSNLSTAHPTPSHQTLAHQTLAECKFKQRIQQPTPSLGPILERLKGVVHKMLSEDFVSALSAGMKRPFDSDILEFVFKHSKQFPDLKILEIAAGNSLGGQEDCHYGAPWLSRQLAQDIPSPASIIVSDIETDYWRLSSREGCTPGITSIAPDDTILGNQETSGQTLYIPKLDGEIETSYGINAVRQGVDARALYNSFPINSFDIVFARHMQPAMHKSIEPITNSIRSVLTDRGGAMVAIDGYPFLRLYYISKTEFIQLRGPRFPYIHV